MSDVPYMKCPICGKNFHQLFDCEHDENDLIEFYKNRITKLQESEANLNKLRQETEIRQDKCIDKLEVQIKAVKKLPTKCLSDDYMLTEPCGKCLACELHKAIGEGK